MTKIIVTFFLIFQPFILWAQCDGTDLIATLSPADRARLTDAADATAHPNGLLWRATKDNTQITLFGTYHFAHARTQAHLDYLKPLIDTSDVVYLEVSNDDQTQLQREIANDPSIMFITDGATLPDLLGPDDWKRLVAEMRIRAIPGFLAARFKPFWAAMMLGIGPCEARSGMMAQGGIDALIGAYAATVGKTSRSLEDYRTILTLFDGFPQEEQLDMIRLFFAWSGSADDLAYTLRQRYLTQDIALIWEFSRYISLTSGGDTALEDFELFESKLLVQRNQDWVDLLMREVSQGHVFIAVGAAHLPGESGVLRLLEGQGFTITRLPFAP